MFVLSAPMQERARERQIDVLILSRFLPLRSALSTMNLVKQSSKFINR